LEQVVCKRRPNDVTVANTSWTAGLNTSAKTPKVFQRRGDLVAAWNRSRHDLFMRGRSIQEMAPDLFSKPANPGDDPSSPLSSLTIAETPRYLLPKDLPQALKALSDQELDQLSAAVLVEQQRRGKKLPSNENAQQRRMEELSVPLSTGKMNAVRAAFKAGLKPPQIARQFRISQADVRKALAGDGSRNRNNG